MDDKTYTNRDFMMMAIEEAEKSICREYDPKVGVVITQGNRLIVKAFRGEEGGGIHAEVSALKKISANSRNDPASGCTVFTTLEPCTKRKRNLEPCASALIARGVDRVVIGMLDPNKDIRGQGEWLLEDARKSIGKFDSDLVQKIRELNRDFIQYETGLGIIIESPAQNERVTVGPVQLRGTFRTRPRPGDRIVSIVRFRNFYAPQQPISFDPDSRTWTCNVWCNTTDKDKTTPHEYELIIARISEDLQMLFSYYSQVYAITQQWIPFDLPIIPPGLEILHSVKVNKY